MASRENALEGGQYDVPRLEYNVSYTYFYRDL